MRTGIKIGVSAGRHVHGCVNFRRLVLLTPAGITLAAIHALKLQANSPASPCPRSLPLAWKHCRGLLLPLQPLPPRELRKGPRPALGPPSVHRAAGRVARRKGPGLTSAGPAPRAHPERRRAFPADGGGLQHGLHVLVLRGVLGVLQPLGLALAGGRAAGELAGLREEHRFVVLTGNSMENRSEPLGLVGSTDLPKGARQQSLLSQSMHPEQK